MLTDEWWKRLKRRAQQRRKPYQNARPFPHAVIDDFYPAEFAKQVASDLADPHIDPSHWHRFTNRREMKLATKPCSAYHGQTKAVAAALDAMNDPRMIEILSILSSIDDVRGDDGLTGGGIHRIEQGGLLKIHTDFNVHPSTKLFRRLNLMVYMNDNWRSSYGGHLELWNESMTEREQRVLPKLNRAVLFSTSRTSWHGHPDPLRCPPDRARVSLAAYYYSPERGPQTTERHGTLFRKRPPHVDKGHSQR
jgi:Rps23 Pro-64 3,4-dihydroxylase Tpa1-like proline 4-hydroxylase